MYELLETEETAMTRFVVFKNIDTGVIDRCFDCSSLVSDINFSFMQIGEEYDCKIELFGEPVDEKTDKSVVCKFVNKNVFIGEKNMVEIIMDKNKYYLRKEEVKKYLHLEIFNYQFTRKDLIEVNGIVHRDLL